MLNNKSVKYWIIGTEPLESLDGSTIWKEEQFSWERKFTIYIINWPLFFINIWNEINKNGLS